MKDISIKINNYKCFKAISGFDSIKNINIIVGRNNSGKSSILDIVEAVVKDSYEFNVNTWRRRVQPEIILETEIPQDIISQIFPDTIAGGRIEGNHRAYGQQLIGRKIKWSRSGGEKTARLISCDDRGLRPKLIDADGYAFKLITKIPIYLKHKLFTRIGAERNILPEKDFGNIELKPDGSGITHAVQCFLNGTDLQKERFVSKIWDEMVAQVDHQVYDITLFLGILPFCSHKLFS